jgi:tRNA(adenine34) deaminase
MVEEEGITLVTDNFAAHDHHYFMGEALKEAAQALAEGELPIGAVVVHNHQVVGRGHATHRQRKSEIAHAEMNAMLQAEQYIQAHVHQGLILYTTVEPCVMCLGTVVLSDMDHIVFAQADRWINPAQMLEIPFVRRHIKNYLGGIRAAESAALLAQHSEQTRRMIVEGRP